ncbi:hypothetical protein GCM10009792_02860 [Microcella alkalica]|uniref:Uncharacterized protein n=2 Tax=Microcella alkalica TaxID=355930 RepID=A0A839E961_9MICO|nr:hypothetical protein [Microcella alkalica]
MYAVIAVLLRVGCSAEVAARSTSGRHGDRSRIISAAAAEGKAVGRSAAGVEAWGMRKLYYAGGSIIISDQVCKSILRYGRALARSGSSDLVVLPAFTENFGKGVAHILLGPASQMLSVPTAEFDIDLADAHMVEILESRTRELQPDRPEWQEDVAEVSSLDGYDWGI